MLGREASPVWPRGHAAKVHRAGVPCVMTLHLVAYQDVKEGAMARSGASDQVQVKQRDGGAVNRGGAIRGQLRSV